MAQAAIDTGDRPVTVSIAAERILDTRTNLGLSGRFADGAPRDLQVTGSVPTASGGSKTVVPADAIGVLVNVTVVTPTHEGFLSLRPQGATGEPTTSTVNFFPGAIEPNGATVDLNDGKIQIWVETSSNTGTADVLIDVVGYTIGHTHDDRYYTEGEVDTAVAAAVAPKADSADVYTKTETDAAVAAAVGPKADSADVYTKTEADALRYADIEFVGRVSSGGTKLGTGLFTVSTSGTGVYFVTFSDLLPFGLPYDPSNGLSFPPVVVAVPHPCTAGATATADWTSYGGNPPLLTNLSFQIRTFDSSGAPVNCGTSFDVRLSQPNDINALLDAPVADRAATPAARPRNCTTTEDGTTCG